MKIRSLFWIPIAIALCSSPPNVQADNDALVTQVVKLLSNSDHEFRAAGLEVIRTSAKGSENTKTFAAQLPKLEPEAQTALISALGDRGDVAAKPAVLEQLTNQQESVRVAALIALGEIGSVAEFPSLINALQKGTNLEQKASASALIRMAGATVSEKIGMESKSAKPEVRSKLIEILAARRATSEAPVIISATTDDDSAVRTAAMNALGQIGQPEQLAAMLPGLLKSSRGNERNNAERNIADVCKRINNEDERGNALIAVLNTVDASQRDELMSLVGRVGGKRLIRFVADIATGSNVSRRAFGIDALSKWPDASPADTLLKIANDTKDDAERRQAFAAFVKVCANRDNRNDKQRLERMKQAMKEARNLEEKTAVINRTRTAYDVESMRFVRPFLDEPELSQIACETIVELAHHRNVRNPHKEEFDVVLDKVIALAKNEEWIERAKRYKRGETWERQK